MCSDDHSEPPLAKPQLTQEPGLPSGDSPFLAVPFSQWLASNHAAFAIADRFPVSRGHALVVPRRVIASWWDATDEERACVLALVDEIKRQLDAGHWWAATTSVRRASRAASSGL